MNSLRSCFAIVLSTFHFTINRKINCLNSVNAIQESESVSELYNTFNSLIITIILYFLNHAFYAKQILYFHPSIMYTVSLFSVI